MASDRTVSITAELVSAYLSNVAVGPEEIPRLAEHVPELIRRIHDAFASLPAGTAHEDHDAGLFAGHTHSDAHAEHVVPAAPVPAVGIDQSVTPDYVVCLEDGLRFKSLRPHLISAHGLTPQAYRAKWGLSPDHPIVAPSYSSQRAQVARNIGLGKGGRSARSAKRTSK